MMNKVDLRQLEYVSGYDENLACPICRHPFINPIALSSCNHYFCEDCIYQHFATQYTSHRSCPTCRNGHKPSDRLIPSKLLANITGDLLVNCLHHELGCDTRLKRADVQDHIDLYCGYALVQCPDEDCDQLVRRRDLSRGCLHFPLSCRSCRNELQHWQLQEHWKLSCAGLQVTCEHCLTTLPKHRLGEHTQNGCSGEKRCIGEELGCAYSGTLLDLAEHASSCVFSRLAPLIKEQKKRLDEQQAAQIQMSRKIEVLQGGFATMENILQLGNPSSTQISRDVGDLVHEASAEVGEPAFSPTGTEFLEAARETSPRSANIPDDANLHSRFAALPPPSTTGGPYASPLHHLLSMHEALRDEMRRMSATLSELDARHSMQSLNENLRTREEISFLAAQVGGLQRQLHWLTSAQLQRQQSRAAHTVSPASGGGSVDGIVDAVSTAATALRGASRIVGVGPSYDPVREIARRGTSEEGRTKL